MSQPGARVPNVYVIGGAIALFAWAAPVAAQAPEPQQSTMACASEPGQRQHCAADTSAGVALVRATGTAVCLLGRNWGYDDEGVWVADGCSGEFVLGAGAKVPAGEAGTGQETVTAEEAVATATTPTAERKPTERIESWGEFEPGNGFLIGRNNIGELAISAYGLVRYVNQSPAEQTFTDHLGNEHAVDPRNDIHPHRAMVFLKGWLASPKLIYNIFFWTVTSTDQDALFVSIGYQFDRRFSLYAGINGLPGTRSVQGSHPFWLGHDRVMADEFFRPYFAYGIWAQGAVLHGLWYNVMLSNNNSALGIKATQLDRRLSYGGSLWFMPTSGEFGPRGSYGDWEQHDELATRFGASMVFSPEERYTDSTTGATGNTTLKLADSLNVFDTGALAPGVTVQNVDYRLNSFDAGLKYKGFFVQAEYFLRKLSDFVADGILPAAEINDKGFYVQAAFYPIPQTLELYVATSQIYGDKDAGFGDSSEYLAGLNYYPFDTRNHRFNFQISDVNRSPVSSTFGYYTGGHDGTSLSAAFSVFF